MMPAAPLVGAVTTAATRGVLLVDRERHQVHPVLGELRITLRIFGIQAHEPVQGATPDPQVAG